MCVCVFVTTPKIKLISKVFSFKLVSFFNYTKRSTTQRKHTQTHSNTHQTLWCVRVSKTSVCTSRRLEPRTAALHPRVFPSTLCLTVDWRVFAHVHKHRVCVSADYLGDDLDHCASISVGTQTHRAAPPCHVREPGCVRACVCGCACVRASLCVVLACVCFQNQ